MAKKWTTRERKKHAKEKYHDMRIKLFVLFASVAVIILLVTGLYYSVILGMNPILTTILIVALVIVVPLAVFIIDLFWFEYT